MNIPAFTVLGDVGDPATKAGLKTFFDGLRPQEVCGDARIEPPPIPEPQADRTSAALIASATRVKSRLIWRASLPVRTVGPHSGGSRYPAYPAGAASVTGAASAGSSSASRLVSNSAGFSPRGNGSNS